MPLPFIGNDVVDLFDEANQRSFHRTGYVERCCSADELYWLSQQTDQFSAFWILWAAKEAAYKVAIKEGVAPFRNPAAIVITLDSSAFMASIQSINCHGTVSIYEEYVHAVAVNTHQMPDYLCHINRREGVDGSQQAHTMLLELAAQNGIGSRGQVSIEKNQQAIPQLCSNGLPLSADISISHDGDWIAVACMRYEQ